MRRVPGMSVLALCGCAVFANVTPIAGGAFMTVVRSNDVNGRVEEQQAKALAQAAAFCGERGARVEVLKQVAEPPPPGQAPSAELDFRCRAKA